jgi:putative SOS response-associated peptidase YedK
MPPSVGERSASPIRSEDLRLRGASGHGPLWAGIFAIALADRGLMALAGLWENWKSPEGEWMRSFAIITTTPNELCAASQPHARGSET